LAAPPDTEGATFLKIKRTFETFEWFGEAAEFAEQLDARGEFWIVFRGPSDEGYPYVVEFDDVEE
jgi:hypothetical protein